MENGASVSTVSSKIELISGLKAFDITLDAVLPFTSLKVLAIRATKTAEGTTTITFSKNQVVLAKLHYIMASLYTHTISFECTSRTIEFFVSMNGNEITLKVFPEKNLSTKMFEAIVRVSKKTGSANIECFINAPSLANEMRIAAELALANPAMKNLVNVDIKFPVAEFKIMVKAVVVELQKIYGDLVKDGLLPDLFVLLNKLELFIRELPKYVKVLTIQFIELFTKYWTIVRNCAMKMWMVYEADIIAFLKNVHIGKYIRFKNTCLWNVKNSFISFFSITAINTLWKFIFMTVKNYYYKYTITHIVIKLVNKVHTYI